nr:ELM2 domain-containing protein [Tanacetum cinerariifolium]
MLFANVMGTADTMKAIVNLTVLRRIRKDTNIAGVDWCGFIDKCLQGSSEPKTLNGFYIGSLCFLIGVKKKQVKDKSSSSEDEKPLKNKKRSKHVKNVKKKKKSLTAEQIKKIEYLSDLPCMRSRTVPFSLFAAIRDSQVDMESFLSDI